MKEGSEFIRKRSSSEHDLNFLQRRGEIEKEREEREKEGEAGGKKKKTYFCKIYSV